MQGYTNSDGEERVVTPESERVAKLEEAQLYADRLVEQLGEQVRALDRAVDGLDRRLKALERRLGEVSTRVDDLAQGPAEGPGDPG